MKKQDSVYIALAIILLASLACNVGGAAPVTESGPSSSAATTVPSQEAGTKDGPPGPGTIDLTNPALYIFPGAPAFIYKNTIKLTGKDATGAAKELLQFGSVEVQTQPQITQHFLNSSEGDVNSAGSFETVIIADQMYVVITGVPGCHTSLASSVQGPSGLDYTLESIIKIQEGFTGQAPLLESGIEINGFVTDKYELSSENFIGDAKPISAFVYVARDGGFVTLYEMQNQEKTEASGFDPNQFTNLAFAYNFIPVEDGSLNISIPTGCDNPAGLAGEFPVMQGAANISTSAGQVSYQLEKPRSEIADFYRSEMPKRGWTLTTEGTLIGISLVFTKEGKNVEVTVASNSDTSSFVAITEK